MHPDGPLCLVCVKTRTWSEGQLCPTCVDAGHRIENGTILFNMEIRLPESLRS